MTRPEPDAARTAAALRERGHDVLLAPLTRIEPVAAELGGGPWAGLLVTSANAVGALEIHPQRQAVLRLPVIAVGDHSAAAARQAGFADVLSAGGAAGDLVRLVAAHYADQGRPLLYLAGADRATDLVAELAAASVPVEMRVVYQAVANPILPPEAAAALRRRALDGVLHFSRRSAEIYLRAATQAGLAAEALAPTQYCLSARIAEPLAAAGAQSIGIAEQPAEDALLQLLPPP